MKEYLEAVYAGKKFSSAEASELLKLLMNNEVPSTQIAALLSAFRMRGITSEELTGFRRTLIALASPLKFRSPVLDICGTGGDGKDTFNISTIAAFVVAGTGILVAKHGNYAVSSNCGSSNVLEALGVKFSSDQLELQNMLDTAGICILHAPLFHPAMKAVGSIRKELGVKTFFNLLGPLVNPAQPSYQYNGVYQHDCMRLYSEVLEAEDLKYTVVHSMDGYDEVSLTGAWKLIGNSGEDLYCPEDLGLTRYRQADLYGGDSVEAAAKIFIDVLSGASTQAQEDVVCINAAFALMTVDATGSIQDCLAAARSSIKSGKAMTALKKLQEFK